MLHNRLMNRFLYPLVAVLFAAACGSISGGSDGGGAGTSGTAGNGSGGAGGGAAGSSGTAGTTGAAGAAGTSGTAGRGGTTGAAGRGGTTGTAGRGGSTGTAGRGGATGAAGLGGGTGTAGTTGKGGSAGTGVAGASGGGGNGQVCTPDPTHGCTSGVFCGNGCCAIGEWCDNTVNLPRCMCGSGLACAAGETCSSVPSGPICGNRCCGGDAGVCPISRRMYKRDIEQLDDAALRRLYDDLRRIQLSTYAYRTDPAGTPRHLGFIIDDTKTPYPINPDGNSVDLYGYMSMAVAAIKVQSKEIEALRAEVARLKREKRAAR